VNNAALIPEPAAGVISYQTVAPPLLPRPGTARAGFIVLGASLLVALGLALLRLRAPMALPTFVAVDFGAHLAHFIGIALVLNAFRRSPLTSIAFRFTFFIAFFFDFIAYDVYAHLVILRSLVAIPFGAVNAVAMFGETLQALETVLWLILLWRVGFAIDSIALCIFSGVVLAVRLLLLLTWIAINGCYVWSILSGSNALGPSVVDNVGIVARDAELFIAPFMLVLWIWCVIMVGPLSKKAAILPT
jgi:hypothetical protein